MISAKIDQKGKMCTFFFPAAQKSAKFLINSGGGARRLGGGGPQKIFRAFAPKTLGPPPIKFLATPLDNFIHSDLGCALTFTEA